MRQPQSIITAEPSICVYVSQPQSPHLHLPSINVIPFYIDSPTSIPKHYHYKAFYSRIKVNVDLYSASS